MCVSILPEPEHMHCFLASQGSGFNHAADQASEGNEKPFWKPGRTCLSLMSLSMLCELGACKALFRDNSALPVGFDMVHAIVGVSPYGHLLVKPHFAE